MAMHKKLDSLLKKSVGDASEAIFFSTEEALLFTRGTLLLAATFQNGISPDCG